MFTAKAGPDPLIGGAANDTLIGGIGNVHGAVLGGFVIALVEQFGAFYLSSAYRDVYVFALLILILLVRPSGLIGSGLQEKV